MAEPAASRRGSAWARRASRKARRSARTARTSEERRGEPGLRFLTRWLHAKGQRHAIPRSRRHSAAGVRFGGRPNATFTPCGPGTGWPRPPPHGRPLRGRSETQARPSASRGQSLPSTRDPWHFEVIANHAERTDRRFRGWRPAAPLERDMRCVRDGRRLLRVRSAWVPGSFPRPSHRGCVAACTSVCETEPTLIILP